jgi:hypothetical protein
MPATSTPAAKPITDAIYHLKIVLMDVAPTIWRRFQVPASMTLATLHRTIQIVMGWADGDWHQFHIAGEAYGWWGDSVAVKDERGALGKLVPPLQPRRRRVTRPIGNVRSMFVYEYDVRDSWRHELRVEKVTRPNPEHRYPRCVAGAWAAPPEGCGGADGYREIRWDLPRGDDVFDVDEANEDLRQAFSLEPECKPPPSTLTLPKAAKERGADARFTSDQTLPEPFETLVRAREGRASPEEERAAFARAKRMLDTCLLVLQSGLAAKSAKKQEHIAKEIALTRKTRDEIERKIGALDEKLGVDSDERENPP